MAPVEPPPHPSSIITNPEGNETESTIRITSDMLEPTITDAEETETESSFYDAVDNLSELSPAVLFAEGKKTESNPAQGTEVGGSGTFVLH